jgi:hypothetical protein
VTTSITALPVYLQNGVRSTQSRTRVTSWKLFDSFTSFCRENLSCHAALLWYSGRKLPYILGVTAVMLAVLSVTGAIVDVGVFANKTLLFDFVEHISLREV